MPDYQWEDDPLPLLDGDDVEWDGRGDTDISPVRLARFEIAPGIFVTIESRTGEAPSVRDLDLKSFNEFLGIEESKLVQEVRGMEQAAPAEFDFAGKNSRGPFHSRQEVASFLDSTGLQPLANIYITDLFGDYPDEDTPDEFIEWWIDLDDSQ